MTAPIDPLASARHSSIRASLYEDVGDFESSVDDISRACRIYLDTGEATLYGRSLIKSATILRWIDPAKGLLAARRGLRFVPRSHSLMRAIGQHAACDNLNESNLPHEAWMNYNRAWATVEKRFADYPRIYLPYRWLAARIDINIAAMSEGSDAEDFYNGAEATLMEVREGYQAIESMQAVALLSLDLVRIYTATRRTEDAIQVASDAVSILRAQRLPIFALQSMLALRDAIADHHADHVMLQSLRLSFARHWKSAAQS